MSEETPDESEPAASTPVVEPYQPFPTFSTWTETTIDSTAFDLFADQLDQDRHNVDSSILSDALQTATKWAAANTGAIEGLYEVDRGFTYSIAVSAAAWSQIVTLKGEFAANSIDDAVRAYDFVLDASTGAHPLTETWIRELHAIVTASQLFYTVLTPTGPQEQTLPKGVYKTQSNSPFNFSSNTVHSYASPLDTAPEMHRLLVELNADSFVAAHPVVQASYAHYAFVCIHPFADGNGRVSRALASTFLYRKPGVPLVIFADQKGDYIDALEAADAGGFSKFVRFVSERAIDTIGMVRAQLANAVVPDVQAQLQALEPLLAGRGGLPHTEIDAIGTRLYDIFEAAMREQIASNPMSGGLVAQVQRVVANVGQPPEGYRGIPNNTPAVYLTISSAPPADAITARSFAFAIARPGTEGPDFVCYADGRIVFDVNLREVNPTVNLAFTYRAEVQALRQIREVLAETASKATTSLRNAGYL